MKKTNILEIPNILNDALQKGTLEKPYSILFVSDCGNGVRSVIKNWIKTIDSHSHELPPTPNSFKLISDSDEVIFMHYELGYGTDISYKEEIISNYLELKNRAMNKDNSLKLIVARTYYSLWNSNKPILGPDEYSMFDEVIEVEMSVSAFTVFFNTLFDDELKLFKNLAEKNDSKLSLEKINSIIEKKIFRKKIGNFILSHPNFKFISIKTNGEKDHVFGGVKCEYFTPSKFMELINSGSNTQEIKKHIRMCFNELNDTEEARQMLLKILEDYEKQNTLKINSRI